MSEVFNNNSNAQWVFVPLGGAGEIGMNLNLYGYKDESGKESWIIVDIGVTFSGGRVPGVDVIMADSAFIEKNRDNLAAIILTHGHEDHIGALAYLWRRLQVPVYATKFTMHLIKGKLREAGLEDVPLHIVEVGKNLQVGPFDLEFIGLTHSIPEPNAIAIRTKFGCVVHTGDWKIDPDPMLGGEIDETRLREIGDEGVLAVIGDSTNIFNEGSSGSEHIVYDSFMTILGAARGRKNRVFITSFASNVARMVSAAKAAQENGRRVALLGRAMMRMSEAAAANNMLGEIQSFISIQEAGKMPPDQVAILCTGSQGEPNAALARIASGRHQFISLNKDDMVLFSSREIPGNEVFISDLQNSLKRIGAEVITARESVGLHVSGHPCRDELATMYKWLKPKTLIPVHGEYRHLVEHKDFAQDMQIKSFVASNGSIVSLAPDTALKRDRVENGRLYVDGKVLIKARDDSAVLARRGLADSGMLSLTIILDKRARVVAPLKLSLSGAPKQDNYGNHLAQLALAAVEKEIGNMRADALKNDEQLFAKVRRAARRALSTYWGKKPETHIHIMRI